MLQSGISYCIPPERDTHKEGGREREDVGRKVRKDYDRREVEEGGTAGRRTVNDVNTP